MKKKLQVPETPPTKRLELGLTGRVKTGVKAGLRANVHRTGR